MEFLAKIASTVTTNQAVLEQIKKANTARHVQEIVIENNLGGFFTAVCAEVYKQMRQHSEGKVELDVILFDFDGKILGRYNSA